ncbi:HBL/NHE enterotoxin family protein [Maridesulfovibrio bastinii]|uniref:HBL/NHE enterotoxin family protein n=1 Tax=Maridesulfovibrio bastinii TaxID=47157 RepID=UPI000409A746|nr:HBL/NHE enterotoxin family protein [Maridesulfovibrio bastinii]
MSGKVIALRKEDGTVNLDLDIDNSQDDLAEYQNAKTVVTSYVQALNNTDISGVAFQHLPEKLQKELPADPKDILATLRTELDAAKEHGMNWSNNIAPDLTAIPQGLINYGTTFQTLYETMRPILVYLIDNPEAPDYKKKKDDVIKYFKGLLETLEDQKSAIDAEREDIEQFNTDINVDSSNFSSRNQDFEVIRQFEEDNIKILNDEIKALNSIIDSLNTEITATAISAGASVGVCAAGIGLIATGGTVKPIVGAVVLVVGMVGVGLSVGFLISAINEKTEEQSKLSKDKLEVSLLTQQCVALTSVETALSTLVDKSKAAVKSVQVILDTWATLQAKLEAVIDDLEKSERHIGDILSVPDLDIANKQWGQLMTFAQAMQNQDVDVDDKNNHTDLEIKKATA